MDSIYSEVLPHPSLASYIETYWVMEVPTTALAFQQMVIPDHCTDLIFDVGRTSFAPFGSNPSKIVGVMTQARESTVAPGNKLLGIRFQPFGGAAALGTSACALINQTIDVSEVCKDRFDIHDQLSFCKDSAKQIEFMNTFFISKLKNFRPIHLATQKAVSIISKSGGSVSVATLAETLGLTRRHLSRSFNENVGLNPKEFLRIERFRAVVKVIDSSALQPDWSALALEYGFYDQAHFIGEFSRIIGASPHRYWKRPA